MRWPWLLVAAALWMGCAEAPPPRNLVLIVFDGMRADRLSAYGYPDQTSPHLDELAEQGVLFESAVSNSSWTLPAMVGLFSGDLPTRHSFDGRLKRSLVETIRSAGIRTAAFVEGGLVSDRFGFSRGFDSFHDGRQGDGQASIEETFAKADAWLRQNAGERFFLLVHSTETQPPYARRDYTRGLESGGLGERFEAADAAKIRQGLLDFGSTERSWLGGLYNGGVAASDRQVGKLLQTLGELDIRDETAVVVTSDHGQNLGGRDPEWPGSQGFDLYDESLLVPLILLDPSRDYAVKRVTTQVRTIDTLHTVIDLLGLPPSEGRIGRSLVPVMEGTESTQRLAWATVPSSKYFDHPKRFALRTGSHKLIMTPSRRGQLLFELYDLGSDPGERGNLGQEQTPERTRLFKTLINVRDDLRRRGLAQYRLDAASEAPATK